MRSCLFNKFSRMNQTQQRCRGNAWATATREGKSTTFGCYETKWGVSHIKEKMSTTGCTVAAYLSHSKVLHLFWEKLTSIVIIGLSLHLFLRAFHVLSSLFVLTASHHIMYRCTVSTVPLLHHKQFGMRIRDFLLFDFETQRCNCVILLKLN